MAKKQQKNKKNKPAIPVEGRSDLFELAVKATPDVCEGYCPGLQALGKYSAKVELENNRLCGGSIEIDELTLHLYEGENRWDYALAYNNEVFYVEVHSAETSEVSTVIRKLKWLKNWLLEKAPEIRKLSATSRTPYYWVQSKKFNIPQSSRQHREAVRHGILPVAKLKLE